MTPAEIVAVAVIVPIVSYAAVRFAKAIGRWLQKSLVATVQEAVLGIVAGPINELRESNSAEHKVTSQRLTSVERRLAAVEKAISADHPIPPERTS